MTIHTLIFSFPPDMTEEDRSQFFEEIGPIMLSSGAERFEHRPHLPLPADDHAPVFVASAIAQVQFADLDALSASFADPDLGDFMGRWQKKSPYRVVWANHEPAL